MACLAGKEDARRARKTHGIDRCRQATGGAWLGAGPAGERKIDSVRTVSTRCARRSTRKPWAAGRRAAWERYPSTRCEAASAETDATAANEARGNAPAGASPTSTAAHAAATLQRIRGSLSTALMKSS